MKCEADAKEIMHQLRQLRIDHEERLAAIDRRYRNELILIFGVGILPYIVMVLWAVGFN